MYRDRDLIAPAQSQSIIELIQSLFVLELIKPSRRVWLGSAWISDIPILDNEALSFSDLEPSWSADMISLSTLLLTIAQRGTEVIIITRESKENRDFIQKIKNSKLYNTDFHHPIKLKVI
jgi:hypothetical protein